MRAAAAIIGATILASAAAAPAAANQVPVTQVDFYRLSSQEPSLVVGAPGILANDSDPDGDPITAELLGPPNIGTVELRRNGRFIYTPPPGFSGLTSFDYLARDSPFTVSQCCGHVYISVTSPPEPEDDSFAALAGIWRHVGAPGVLANDTADRARLVDGPDHGTVRLGADGRFAYRSNPGFAGLDTFTYYAVIAGEEPEPATVTMRVKASNDEPQAATDTYLTEEDTPILIDAPGVLGNDFDADGDPLRAELVSSPLGSDFDFRSDGSFEYYPPPDYDSPVSFTYRADDGLVVTDPVPVQIEIRAVDDPPVAEDDEYHLGGATTLTVSSPGVLANDYDTVEGDALRARLRGIGTRRGTLSLSPNGSFTYVRDPGAHGIDHFRYQVRDSGGAIGNTAYVSIYR